MRKSMDVLQADLEPTVQGYTVGTKMHHLVHAGTVGTKMHHLWHSATVGTKMHHLLL